MYEGRRRNSYKSESSISEVSEGNNSEVSINFYETAQDNSYFPHLHQTRIVMANSKTNQSLMENMQRLFRPQSLEEMQKVGTEEMKNQYFEAKTQTRIMQEEMKELKKRLEEMRMGFSKSETPTFQRSPQATAPLAEDLLILSEIQEKRVKSLLESISEYDGKSDIESFIDDLILTIKRIRGTNEEKDAMIDELLRRCKAKKFKGEAHQVVCRIRDLTLNEMIEELRLAFGQTGKSLEQLQQERNQMCQMRNEKVESFIRRYSDLERQIQRAIDVSPAEYRKMKRQEERQAGVKKFIRCLRPEIKTEVHCTMPATLNEAYQKALEEEKEFFDKERERSRLTEQYQRRQTMRSQPTELPQRQGTYKPPMRSTAEKMPTCTYCRKYGHSEEKCYLKQNKERKQNFSQERPHNKDPPRKTYAVEEATPEVNQVENQEEYFYPQEETDTNPYEFNLEDTDFTEDYW